MSTRTTTPSDVTGTAGGRRGWVGPVLAVLAVVVALGGIYVGAAYALADRVPFNTTAAGVAIGGRSAEEAVALLESEVGDRATRPVQVSVGADVDEIDPAEAGLAVDLESTVGSVTGFSLAPQRMWRHVVGAGRLDLLTDVEATRLDAELAEVAARLDVPAADGDVTFPEGVPTRVDPVEGRAVDVAGASAAVRSMWLATDGPIPLPADTVAVQIGQDDVDAALLTAEAAVAGDLVVVVGDREVALTPAQYGPTLVMDPVDAGGLGLAVDVSALRAVTLAADPELETEAVDAQVVLADGAPTVVPGTVGRSLPEDALGAAAVVALAPDGDRRALVEGATVEPEFSTADAEALGIVEVVSTFTTEYPADNAPRTNNLRVASETIDGTLLAPDDVFDLNEVLGERTTAKGYQAAGVISDGVFTEGVGGGVSQVSTTTYNAAFFAGLEVLDFKPHSYYIDRYPVGREATLNYSPPVDMRFRNDTDTGILVQAGIGGGEITVTFWGTKTWDVESVTSSRRDVREGGVRYDDSDECTGQAANTGFTVDTTRIWRDLDSGEEVKRETNTWRYSEGDRIICGTDPDA
ncbi:VanW family protein [Aquipuribacter sp. MA13-6]|uniref:VanW family protein n=1 Tax=unclassified Aquipuribacter TaxID=2635084 RepID=UPI003EEF82A8